MLLLINRNDDILTMFIFIQQIYWEIRTYTKYVYFRILITFCVKRCLNFMNNKHLYMDNLIYNRCFLRFKRKLTELTIRFSSTYMCWEKTKIWKIVILHSKKCVILAVDVHIKLMFTVFFVIEINFFLKSLTRI